MKDYYQIKKRNGYYRIGSAESVFSYLIVGTERAALIDTGYGLGDLKAAVEQYRAETGDQRAAYLPLPDANGDVGSRLHPSRDAHRRAAAVIAEAIRRAAEEDRV